jgi:menaquinone-dependent protoporphyrinogen oxidase
MRVLIAVASKHGSTTQIGAAIGGALIDAGMSVDIVPVEEVTTVRPYSAVIVGSAVYMGRWMEEAKRFCLLFEGDLVNRQVWLFSSGPLGDPPKPVDGPVEVAELMTATQALGHRVFAGSLDKGELGLGERAIVAAVKAPAGDYRPWDDIEAWATEIAHELNAGVPA